jgi:hypothetical protein
MIESLKSNLTQLIVATTIVLVSAIVSLAIYHYNERVLMSKNIEMAMGKSIDPLSIRCSYASHVDAVCVAYTFQISNKK